MKTVSVVTPVYYNEGSLGPLLTELLEVEARLQEGGMALELIFVDDGSGDRSFEELLKIKERRPATKIIKLTRNFGAIHATKTGFRFVTGDCFMNLAADLQDPPDLILQVIEPWQRGSKFVLATRSHRGDPLSSRFFAWVYYVLLRLFVVKDYPRGGFDLALMDKALLPYLNNSSKNINTPLFAFWLGFKPDVIEYARRKRTHGKSRWNFWKRLKLFIDAILGFSIVPIRMISLIGVIVSILSFGYGFLILFNTLVGRSAVPGFATIVALTSFLLGLVIIMLGVIGEYLWRIFDETNKRPEAVIDEIY
ncbi:MAG TPA: glycosyltransferase family 2 protein [Chthoniobacterales bacterium]|jgi:dolichol-phosphate mannosyltransferase|nr:glycosyltransferase family 2 protein [Chthoniobacterales bacterium]